MLKEQDIFPKSMKDYTNGTLNTLNYKHPKYCYYIKDHNIIYKVIGYHNSINQYKIQNTKYKR